MKVAGAVAALLVGVATLSDRDPAGTTSAVGAAEQTGAELGSEDVRAAPSPDVESAEPGDLSVDDTERGEAGGGSRTLLQAAAGGDGDSWRDVGGKEYRLGLVNAPEYNECFGSEATAERKELTAGGFQAEVYTVDRYGRSVAVVTTADGVNVNVHLARHGFADDTYLARFRHENPSLAGELDTAFAAARAEGAGLWSACSPRGGASGGSTAAPPPAGREPEQPPAPEGGCHPDYLTCIPVKGDGSGRGAADDLDCGDLRTQVQLRRPGTDPYRLDANGDGYGCESYG